MRKVLVVDDDKDVIEIFSLYLQREGFQVIPAYSGTEALKLFHKERPDIVILDIMLPGMDGWEVCKVIRGRADTPILMLTARTEEADRVLGLELGADDYVVKPFSPREVVARVKAILRRREVRRSMLTVGSLTLDREGCEVSIKGKRITLTPKQFEILWILANNAGRVVRREEMVRTIWGDEDYIPDERVVDQHIKRMRKLLEGEVGLRLETVRGVGYRLVVES